MARRRALALLASCAALVVSGQAGAREISVYGIELEVSEERERLLIFADAPIEPQLLPVDERTLMVALPGSVLDPSAPTQVTPVVQGTVVRVTAFDRAAAEKPEVRVVVQHRPGVSPRIERRASVVALDFEPMPRAAQRPDMVRVAYRNAPFTQVVTDLARATGESLVFDENLAALGTVTIEGPPQVTRAEALALIDSMLLLRGFAAVHGPGGARKIVAISGSPSPWRPDAKLPDSDAPVTTLLPIRHANAGDLIPVLTPYLGANAVAAAFEPTNSLILSGPASLLRTLRIAIEALDRDETGAPLIWPMRVARAETVAEQLKEIASRLDVPYVSSDPRLNAVLLRVRPGETERIRALVDRLDRPAEGAGSIQVVKLRYADPEQLAEQLTQLRSDTGGQDAAGAVRRAGLRGLEFEVVADVPTHSLVLRGPPEAIDAVLDVVDEIDRVPASVRVTIAVASIDLDDRLVLGVDYLIPLTNPRNPQDLIAAVLVNPSGGGLSAVDPSPSTALPFVASFTKEPLLIPIRNPITGAAAVLPIPRGGSITMNGATANTELLMRPTLLITSGEEHEIFAGDNVPIPVADSGGGTGTTTGTTTGGETSGGETGTSAPESEAPAPTEGASAALAEESGTGGTGAVTGTDGLTNSALTVSQNIERKDVGTSLRVTPTIGERGGVTLELRVEVSALAESVAGPVEEVGPTIKDTTIESTIRLQGGEFAVIATAAQPKLSRTKVGIPWLMDIPILGWAFRVTSEQTLNRHLLVAAQAQILRPESRDLADRFARELGATSRAARAEQREP
jgi:general secretion pathway protein D